VTFKCSSGQVPPVRVFSAPSLPPNVLRVLAFPSLRPLPIDAWPTHSPFNSYRLALQCRRRGGRRLSVGNTPVAQILRDEDERIHRQWQGCRQIQDRRKVLVPISVRCGTFRGRVSACCRIAGNFSDDQPADATLYLETMRNVRRNHCPFSIVLCLGKGICRLDVTDIKHQQLDLLQVNK